MKKNTGIPYELLTKRIFQDILNQSEVKTILVQHNVSLKGKSAVHQIDVYWKFELNGISYETIVQSKDWNQAVSQGALLQFKAILDDLPGSPVGIFVTRTGYQAGAREYATTHGIILYELREPKDEDFNGRIKEIHLRIISRVPHVTDQQPMIDVAWARGEKERLSLTDQETKIQLEGMADEIHFKDSEGRKIISFHDASTQLAEKASTEESLLRLTFESPLFLDTNNPAFPLVRCLGVQAKIRIVEDLHETILKAEDTVAFILKNVISGDIQTFKG